MAEIDFFVYYAGTLSLKYVFWTQVEKIDILVKKHTLTIGKITPLPLIQSDLTLMN